MYFRCALLITFLYCFTLQATAQQLFTVKGVVYKKSSPERVAQVLITNLSTQTVRISDELGGFQMPAKTGDTLLFKKIDYAAQIFVVYSMADVNIYLQPVILLNEVSIKEQSKKQEINDMMKLYKNQGGYYTLNPSTWSVISSPLTGLYELFGQAPNRARRFQEHTREEVEHIEVGKKYTAALVKKVTGVTDEKEVKAFMDAFTPAYEDIKVWSDYDLVRYIKKSYEYYKKNKGEFKLQKLY
jgi:hypothetical protein